MRGVWEYMGIIPLRCTWTIPELSQQQLRLNASLSLPYPAQILEAFVSRRPKGCVVSSSIDTVTFHHARTCVPRARHQADTCLPSTAESPGQSQLWRERERHTSCLASVTIRMLFCAGSILLTKGNQLKECFRLASTDTDDELPRQFAPYRRSDSSRDLRSENQMIMYVVFISRWVENMASWSREQR